MSVWLSQSCLCQEKPIRLVAERLNCSDLLNGKALPAAGSECPPAAGSECPLTCLSASLFPGRGAPFVRGTWRCRRGHFKRMLGRV